MLRKPRHHGNVVQKMETTYFTSTLKLRKAFGIIHAMNDTEERWNMREVNTKRARSVWRMKTFLQIRHNPVQRLARTTVSLRPRRQLTYLRWESATASLRENYLLCRCLSGEVPSLGRRA